MNKRLYIVLICAGALSFGIALALYPGMPYYVPIHWNYKGQIDNFGPKWINLIVSAVPLLVAAGMAVIPLIDPRRTNYQKHPRAYAAMAISLTLILGALSWVINISAFGYWLPVGSIISILVGISMVVIGNFMPQLRSNFFAGIRTPWALENETVWRKTQRAGGIVFCIFGLMLVVSAFFTGSRALALIPIAFILPAVFIVYIYSYRVYRRQKASDQPAPDEDPTQKPKQACK